MPLLADHEIEQRLSVSRWRRSGQNIVREWQFEDFRGAIAFVDHVADMAEEAGHHPDILIHGYRNVRLELSTHSVGGLTGADFDLAAQIDQIS
jgi:4a-hydroxytetrahydrobiopterin dehydratase